MMYYGRGFGMMQFGGGIIMGLVALAFLVLMVLAIIALVKYLKSTSALKVEKKNAENAMVVLNERYAKGEITKEEYLDTKSELKKV